ncbi:hypothetical protein [Marivirga arenosa]|uniref:DUF4412 domain-containing protein n=1 Tax=Marivirga arenosa TaxID=3059076 RepID=A0AA51RB95_9BACT|nr:MULTISPECIES: hypothetical protein [unclassified Marivirga]WMN07718.1 hypothetical protein QYS48_29650 [Marivirga sp. ABR2-2]WNB18051.1 hypothetical protein QYS47_29030 [Marivirga sp. BKB1-2]
MNKKLLLLALTMLFVGSAFAQKLLSPSFTYSHKKTSYITLKDGTEITGTIKDLDRKKGLIDQIKIEKEDGKKVKLKPEDIKEMYLPQSGLDKVSQAMDAMSDAQKWNNEQIDQDLLDDGYVYFENAMVYYKKKKKMELLMQLLNPTFSKEVKVYHDPMAKQTMSVGVGGVTLAGGLEKSYFVKTNDGEAAYKLKKKDYDEEYEVMWEGCDELMNSTDRAWKDLSKHVVAFSDCQ